MILSRDSLLIIGKNNIHTNKDWPGFAKENGVVLLIDKEQDWTSFDVVAKLRSFTKIKKIGHAGTLDPLATGLLIVCAGRQATKQIDTFQGLQKVYTGQIKFGATTKTDDSEAEEENIKECPDLNIDIIQEHSKNFIGDIEQVPPIFSAKKIKGKRLYKMARSGEQFTPKPATVSVSKFDILDYSEPVAKFYVECSKGTYIRSLARDLGESLGCGAYLKRLRRNAIGEINVENALKINEIIDLTNKINID